MNAFINCIVSQDPAVRNQSFESLCVGVSSPDLINYCCELEEFRKSSNNLYHKVRASLFLYAAYRFHLQTDEAFPPGHIPHEAFQDLLERRFESAIKHFNHYLGNINAKATLFSGLASAYKQLAYDTLGQQVRQSVRSARGNQWMFRVGHYLDHPLRIHPLLLERTSNQGLFPILREDTPVRMDLTHSGWSDIFFLGMDYPESARVINVSADLGVYKRDEEIRPPISSFVRVIEEPVIHITSLDLNTAKDIQNLND